MRPGRERPGKFGEDLGLVDPEVLGASMRPGRETPRKEELAWIRLTAGSMLGFNEAGARTPRKALERIQSGGKVAPGTASMRPGRERPGKRVSASD